MTIASSLYVGSVMHRRLHPRHHRFRYRAFWLLIDLDELSDLSGRLRWFSHNRFNLFSLHDTDHGDGSATTLRKQAERLLAGMGIDLAGGSIRLLCMPRTWGYGFNPLSIYFCYRHDGRLAALIHQVHNTFGKRHSYVIPVNEDRDVQRQSCGKRFYVSPFLDMDLRYDFRVAGPDEGVGIGICASAPSGMPVLNAVLIGRRKALTDRNLLLLAAAIPAVTLKVIAAIHWEALRLWLKGLRFRAPAREAPTVGAVRVTPNSRTN
jgi:DUF1365 family protein